MTLGVRSAGASSTLLPRPGTSLEAVEQMVYSTERFGHLASIERRAAPGSQPSYSPSLP